MPKLVLLFLLPFVATGATLAQDPVDEDAAFDDALRNFGYTAGLAWQCTDAAAQSATVDRVNEIFHRVSQLFGTDRAFQFAAAFGAGTVDRFDRAECELKIAAFRNGTAPAIPAEDPEP